MNKTEKMIEDILKELARALAKFPGNEHMAMGDTSFDYDPDFERVNS